MSLFNFLRKKTPALIKAFHTLPSLENKEKREVDYQKLISRYSTGNVSLQKGSYLTESDVEARRNLIRSHQFIDGSPTDK
jgi:hypothetical protein